MTTPHWYREKVMVYYYYLLNYFVASLYDKNEGEAFIYGYENIFDRK